MSARSSNAPLRLLLLVLLTVSALGAVQAARRRERGDEHARGIAARAAALRAPAGRGMPAVPDLDAALPPLAEGVPVARLAFVAPPVASAGPALARVAARAPSARAPPR